MAILLADNFSYLGRKPLDGRILIDTIANMATMADSVLYDGIIAYNQEDQQYYTWDSNNDDEPDLGRWRLLVLGGTGNANILEYGQDKEIKKDTLILFDGKLFVATQDFTSDATGMTKEASFNIDLDAGNLIPITQDMSDYMPVAPRKHNYSITNAGTGYAVNDIIRTTINDVFVEVTQVDDDGAILEVEESADDTPQESGSNAKITATPIMQVGYQNEWFDLPALEGGGDANLTEEIISNVTVGGAEAGTKFDKDLAFTEVMKMLLLTTIIPKITFSATGAGLHEDGTIVNGTTLKLVINNMNKVTTVMNQVQFKVAGTVVDTQVFVDGQDTYTFVSSDPITSNTEVGVTFTYDDTKTLTGKESITFVKASYYGPVDTLTPDEDTITGLTKVVKDKKAFTWDNASLSDQHFCYAYPASLGNLTSIKDANNFEYLSSYTKTTDTIDGAAYNIYVLTDPVTITGAKQVYA